MIDDGTSLLRPLNLYRNVENNEYEVVVFNGTDAIVFSSGDCEIYPLSPSYDPTTRIVTIPEQIGVMYYKDDSETALVPGEQSALEIGVETISIRIVVEEGYVFDPEAVLEWVFDTRIEVKPAAATFNTSTGVITIPSATGCSYEIDGIVAQVGPQDPIAKDVDVVVTVVADLGYKLDPETASKWTFAWYD